MEKLTNRQFSILSYLIQAEDYVDSKRLSIIIGVASKTIRKDIDMIARFTLDKYGVKIESKSSLGYRIAAEDTTDLRRFVKEFQLSGNALFPYTNNEYRVHYVIQRLIAADSSVKINDLSEELYVSRTTITNDLKAIRTILSQYNLTIAQVPNYGLYITGIERHKRFCLINEYRMFRVMRNSMYAVKDFEKWFLLEDTYSNIIETTLHDFLKSNHTYTVSSAGIEKILLALLLMVNRKKHGHHVKYSSDELYDARCTHSYDVARIVLQSIGKRLNWSFDEDDFTFIGTIMLGFRNILCYEEVFSKRMFHESMNLAVDVLEFLSDQTKIVEIKMDLLLREQLTTHFISMTTRLRYHLIVDYIPGNIIYKKGTVALELAALACCHIRKKLGYEINQNETIYMAFVFYASLSRFKSEKNMDNRIAIVSTTGRDIALAVGEQMFTKHYRFTKTAASFETYNIPLIKAKDFDLIVSDMPKEHFAHLHLPVLDVQFLITPEDDLCIYQWYYNKFDKWDRIAGMLSPTLFFDKLQIKNRQELINCMIKKMAVPLSTEEEDALRADFEMRFSLCPIEKGNNIGFFKTLYTHRLPSGLYIFVLEEPILWNAESVQIVFALHLNQTQVQELTLFRGAFEQFIISSDEAYHMLLKPTFDTITGALHTYYMSHFIN